VTRAVHVLAAAHGGDASAIQIVTGAGEALGSKVGWLVNVMDPGAIVVGGGLGVASGLYWESLVNSARAHIWSDINCDLPIVPALHGDDAWGGV